MADKPISVSTMDASLMVIALVAFRRVVDRQVRLETDSSIKQLRSRQLQEVDVLISKLRSYSLDV